MNSLLIQCRPGFETEAASEIALHAEQYGAHGYARTQAGQAWVEWVTQDASACERLMREVRFNQLIFIRQWARGQFVDLPEKDRLTSLLGVFKAYPRVAQVWLEVPDTNDGKSLASFCKKFTAPLEKGMHKVGCLRANAELPQRIQLFFLNSQRVFVGLAERANAATWPMGIPRLKFPREAPSRSTLKLEEAWHHFVPREQWDSRLAPAMTAVDLGAAPGGWTWQLVQRHIRVSAVDNGPMDPALMDSGLVEHFRADGYQFEPRKSVDWMVCDIVERPARTAWLIEQWLGHGWCREAVVNLKLPMKKRFDEVQQILMRLEEFFDEAGVKVSIRCKQLYHDREEVTCHLRRFN
ncbi:23S rRNA (cytidine(2498)-2'-O)-methyltransferase RlmM [Atopomonas sediminilitoris]|uniref:23S rRNA (cytidine(2498)-2'-O)-methyltransferase RlmM n=1 Tax=Atopomonas sediminilitoris TaxID=2919919 RepID=UPI001F4EEC87|nr:23S rRNA (cytidine(2498)-2'-O)-methyltransferase RlmM [Atopomonas sediminilitoris]MCJ8169173.1 23S rRNA (cytidine(2498)-2'-O)-methyltransferase RlmM [Atopomonas sediminilitoris]